MKSKLHEQLTKAVKNTKLQETLKQYPSLTSVDIAEMLTDELERMDALEGNQENEVIVNQSYEG